MKKPGIECPYGRYGAGMRIKCDKTGGGLCAFQYWRVCKGWAEQTESAAHCVLRENQEERQKGVEKK